MVFAVASLGISPVASADSASENQLLSLINSARVANGLGPLTVDGSLRTHARNHSAEMLAVGTSFHSTTAELQTAAGSGWTRLGENVAVNGSADLVHASFMNSSGHRANILGEYNYVGIGTVSSGGNLFVTVVFMEKGSSPSPTTTTTRATTTSTSDSNPTTTSTNTATTVTVQPTTTTGPPDTTTTMDVGPDKAVTPGQSCLAAGLFGQICHE